MMTIHTERPCNAANYRKGRKQAVKYLVVHYVGATGGAENNAKYYGSTPGINASAHYFVGHGPSPEIWASVPEGDTAWHVGAKKYVHPDCRNDNAIGVELCCHQDGSGKWYFDPETVDAAVELCRDIVARYGIPRERVLRHYDVTGKVCPAPFVNDQGAWESFKERVFVAQVSDSTVDKPDGWAEGAWEWAKAKGILDGTRPHDAITRQELAAVLNRLGVLG